MIISITLGLSILLPYDSGKQFCRVHIRQIKRYGYEDLGKDHREDYFTSQHSYKSTERKKRSNEKEKNDLKRFTSN